MRESIGVRALRLLAGAILVASCSVPAVSFTPDDHAALDGGLPGPATATITISRAGAASGAVSAEGLDVSCAATCTTTVTVGARVTLVARPDVGATFGGWLGEPCAGVEPSCTITVTQDLALSARFDVAMFTVDVGLIGSGGGNITSTPEGVACPGTCSISLPYNAPLELLAQPSATSSFLGWGGDCASPTRCAFMVTTNITATAAFATNDELVVSRTGNGTGRVRSRSPGIDCGTDCAERYAPGTAVTLSAEPTADSTFDGWTGEGCTGTEDCRVTITAAAMVAAKFTLKRHALQVTLANAGTSTVTVDPPGLICGSTCSSTYDAHTSVTLTAGPDSNSRFVGWTGDCSGTDFTCEVAIERATAVTATFERRRFDLNVRIVGAGSVRVLPNDIICTADCSRTYDAGTTVTLEPSALTGATFVGWSGDCTGSGVCQLPMTAARNATATFARPGRLIMIDAINDRVLRVDPDTLAVIPVGPLGIAYEFGDCTWNPADSKLYVVDGRGARSLYRVDLNTGAATLVGPHNIVDVFSLAYHPPSGKLYGISYSDTNLYVFSTTTGAATLVGSTGRNQFDGLAWDSKRNMMVASIAGGATIFSINVANAALSPLAQPPNIDNHGLVYDPILDRIWLAEVFGKVYKIDPNNGYTRTLVGTVAGQHTCIALVPSTTN